MGRLFQIVYTSTASKLFTPEELRQLLAESNQRRACHFAALAYVAESMADPPRYNRHNVAGSLTLLDTLLEAGVNLVVFSSSCAVYGRQV